MMIRLSAPSAICTRVTENSATQNPGSRRRSSIQVSVRISSVEWNYTPHLRASDTRCSILDAGYSILDPPIPETPIMHRESRIENRVSTKRTPVKEPFVVQFDRVRQLALFIAARSRIW